jgi:cytochrome c-type biogenesis protein CcmH/NrfF
LAGHYSALRFLALVIAILMATSISAGFASSGKTSVQEVSEALTCQCGCGLTVANCNHPQCEFSVPALQQIERMIAQGMGRDRIIGVFRARYGEKILSAPTSEGFNLLAGSNGWEPGKWSLGG